MQYHRFRSFDACLFKSPKRSGPIKQVQLFILIGLNNVSIQQLSCQAANSTNMNIKMGIYPQNNDFRRLNVILHGLPPNYW
ncbi:hypothetical protein IN40_21500 [Salmonella enterica]|nr:hypothetical protein BAR51_23265 [Salmonella enterica subsp. enterica serovar Infantis]KTM70452.1 hypothetical protein IN32_00265 [Salmonella enterica]APS05435.1 hypothetical protein ATD18_23270 [Salmonella enterica subsp. enterica serovar Infantis]APS10112.1 hypothetical protein BBV18_23275 [Salmonella enterica subsp. enterica serovar Infantis]APS14793.1 hypothetical protein APL92_23270 [Salmonella enterica subsp. enterica serovar Infantis]